MRLLEVENRGIALRRVRSGVVEQTSKVFDIDESFLSVTDLERELNKWINQFVSQQEVVSASVRARRPLKSAKITVSEVAGNAALVSLPLAVALLALPRPNGFAATLLCVTALSFSAAAVATNVFHRWAHAASPPRVARRLQRLGLILTPMRHALHHRGEHDRAYCVTSGWLNPVLDRLGFFARLERMVGRVAGETSAASASSRPELRSETLSR